MDCRSGFKIACPSNLKGRTTRKFLDEGEGKNVSHEDGIKIQLGKKNWILIIPDDSEDILNIHIQAETESSDWFWWYGDDHSTAFDLEFDQLFREHLIIDNGSFVNILFQESDGIVRVPISSEKRKICSVKGNLCVDFQSGEVIEISILKDCFCGNDFDYVRIVIEQGGEAAQTLPSYGSLKLYANENYAKNRFV